MPIRKLLESFDCCGLGELFHSHCLGLYWSDAVFCDMMSHEIGLLLARLALG